MGTGVLILAGITLVLGTDVFMAIYYRGLADRVESGETVRGRTADPDQMRMIARLLLISAPLIWLVTALFCFGVIPSTIDPIKF